jgi:hypothetical protein
MISTTPRILAVLSVLHEGADVNAATRRFRNEPVLAWTLRRLSAAAMVESTVLLCWDDQLAAIEPIASTFGVMACCHGTRRAMPHMESVSAARRWSDGWRGGPMGTSAFDAGFDGVSVLSALRRANADAVALIDPAAALLDPQLVDAVIGQWQANQEREWAFSPAATGLACMVLGRAVLERLASTPGLYPGRMLHYFPDQVSREPLADARCAPTPTLVARSLHRFTVTGERQRERIESATVDLNGQLVASSAEAIVARMNATAGVLDRLPREVVLELTPRRLSKPIFSASAAGEFDRPDLPAETAMSLIDELASLDDARLTIAGVGDPMLHADLPAIIRHAADRGVAVNVETDLLADDAAVLQLADSPADVVSVHLPATTPATYAAVMGIDAYGRALRNVQTLAARRAAAGRGIPLLIPVFTKCRQNQHEMEAWYDQWLRAVGTAVITSPSTFGGRIADVAPADMSPPRRISCRRLSDRITVLSDGRYVSCDQDVAGRQPLARAGETPLGEVWIGRLNVIRDQHARQCWNDLPVCAGCREWHRP